VTLSGGAAGVGNSERVLVLVRGSRNAEVTRDLLVRAGFEASLCANLAELVERAAEGAGAALLDEEALASGPALDGMIKMLRDQPPWSDFPIVVFSAGATASTGGASDLARLFGNVTFLDRPVRTRSMLASMHAAIRSRRRQYEARHAIEARDMFLAMLGHELRNPLGAIRLSMTMLERKTLAADLPKEIAVIDRQARHLTRLVDDLLDVARVTQGKVKLERERLNLVDVALSAFEAQEVRARTEGVSYAFDAPPDVVWVDGDRQRLEQVLANLIANAIKYTPRGGMITVSVAREEDEAVVRVIDTGLGIPPGMIARLFDAFAQADRTLDRREGGIGLGLALVRSLVQLHGGTAEGASEGPDRGSTFTVRLPAVKEPVAPAAKANGTLAGENAPARRIVVVEDSDDNRELLAELLTQAGHTVSCAEDGPGGLEKLLAVDPDIAFIDLGLPGFDGLELARRARARGSHTTLVAVTGYGQPEDRAHALDAGFDDQLTKPIDDDDLRRIMHRLGPHAHAAGATQTPACG
jgi:signal transduction histidine kinase/ActR/RegA family two-component response regulator